VPESPAARALAKAGFLHPTFGANWCTKHENVSLKKRFEDRTIRVFKSKRNRRLKTIYEFGGPNPSGVLGDIEAGYGWVAKKRFTKHLI
jgi:hypothetical protein